MKKFMILSLLGVGLGLAMISHADQTMVAKKVVRAPRIDGNGADKVWGLVEEYITHDTVAKIDISLKAVYTDSEIFFLVSYPDSNESNTHKTWVWDKALEVYRAGSDREDVFVFKWNMEPNPVDLSLKADNEYVADTWFWKANRTNPVGYADDKVQRLSAIQMPKAKKLTSRTGKTRYLTRKGDGGTSAYKGTTHADHKGDRIPKYSNRVPKGSRADIKAKGVWSGGRWTIEFGRSLNTGNTDDIQFDTSKSYLFGVSRYEVAGRRPNPKLDQPLYGSGDIGEAMTLRFGDQVAQGK